MSFFEKLVSGIESVVEQALGINLLDMIVQILATLILVLIVKKFFWGRITEFLEKRKAYMEKELTEAEKTNSEAFELKKTREKELKEIREKSKNYFENAKQRGKDEESRIINHAKREADTIITNAQKEIESEQKKAKETLQKEIVSIASLMAEKVIRKKVDASDFQDLTIEDIESSEEL
ncbi:MAG: F0F1 ATP synthase subunit B [Candidatus Izimaplasma sp.]|nr:F0F1 ATP synthase subunit B [Candidatus Izimaplasma bacterium]